MKNTITFYQFALNSKNPRRFMKRRVVNSSFIRAIGYDPANEILEIAFSSSDEPIWQYFEVPEDVYYEFMEASSVGSYYQNEIKPFYESQRIK